MKYMYIVRTKNYEFYWNGLVTDDSDDNSGGERTRFKSERQITSTVTTRNTSAIPETLGNVIYHSVTLTSRFNNLNVR